MRIPGFLIVPGMWYGGKLPRTRQVQWVSWVYITPMHAPVAIIVIILR